MNDIEWAEYGVRYLSDSWRANHEEMNDLQNQLRDLSAAREKSWYKCCKALIPQFYEFYQFFAPWDNIPNSVFSSPAVFEEKLNRFKKFLDDMVSELDTQTSKFKEDMNSEEGPYLVLAVRQRSVHVIDVINHVFSQKTSSSAPKGMVDDLELVKKLCRRFHESVLSLKKHPHGGNVWQVSDEWDCQYLFRSILAAYFPDVRREEWTPSVGGSSARCEFFIKPLRMMIELKYARREADQNKFKKDLALDLLDYGRNGECDYVVVLIYDPQSKLTDAIALQKDLSRPTADLKDVLVVVSPPRDS